MADKGGNKWAMNKLGSWSFLVGLILAVVLGLGLGSSYEKALIWIVFLVGIVVGLLNITAKEVGPFLTAGTVLVLLSFLGVSVGVFKEVTVLESVLKGVLTLFVPATVIVALKSVFSLARD